MGSVRSSTRMPEVATRGSVTARARGSCHQVERGAHGVPHLRGTWYSRLEPDSENSAVNILLFLAVYACSLRLCWLIATYEERK